MNDAQKLFSIRVAGLPDPLAFTSNDLISIKSRIDYKSVRYLRKYRNIQRRSITDFDLPTHAVSIHEISIGDWLLLPRRQNLSPINLTTDQLYIAGFWLAEGHHLKESKKGTRDFGKPIGICFTNTDLGYLEKIQPVLHEWFPNSASHIRTERLKNPKHNAKHVLEFRSREASRFFYPNFGEYSFGKFVADSIYEHSNLLPLVCGYIDGDGCQFSKGKYAGQVVLITTSHQLAYQLRQILLDEGIWTTLQYKDHSNPNHRRTYSLTVTVTNTHKLIYATKVTTLGAGRTNNLAIPTPEGFYAKVKGILPVSI